MCVEMGGSITGEHGIGMEKRDYLPEMFSADEIDCLKRVRAAFDPLGIANPGKMFPEMGAPALVGIVSRGDVLRGLRYRLADSDGLEDGP